MTALTVRIKIIMAGIKQDNEFFKNLFKLGLPIALQNLVATSLNMVDTLMIGQLGETAIAAVALSNQIFFLMMLLMFGISSGTAVFTAQFWGKNDMEGIHRSLGLALILGVAGAGLFTLGGLLLPRRILGIFTEDQAVIAAAVPYLRLTSISYIFTAVTFVFQGVMRSTGIVRLPLVLSVGALSLNAVFNYLLIFGKLGMPELGITGAALATTGARIIEMVLLVSIIYLRKYPVAAGIRQMANQNLVFLKRYAWKVTPVILNEIGWSLGITMFTLIYARMGTSILTAYNITDTFSRLTFVVFIGSANAAAIVLGNMIGEGKRKRAEHCARTILLAAPLVAAFFSVFTLVVASVLPSFFNISEESGQLITIFMRISAVIMFIKVSNMHIIVGLLRSGGDTHYCMALELIPLWLISIPLVAFCGLVLHMPPPLVFTVSLSEEVIKYIIGLRRVLSGKWVHDLT